MSLLQLHVTNRVFAERVSTGVRLNSMSISIALAVVSCLVLSACTVDHHIAIKRSEDSYRPAWCDTADATEKQKYPGQCL